MKSALIAAALGAALMAGSASSAAAKNYGYGKGHYSSLAKARAYGQCLYPQQIRRKLAHYGWHGFDVVKLRHNTALICSYRHGKPYELKVDRCTGEIYRTRPLYGGGYRNGYGY